MRAEQAEAVGVVDEDAEVVFLLEGDDLVQLAEGAGHAVHAFRDEQDAAAVLLRLGAGAGEDLLAVRHVVVAVFVLVADVEADAVQEAGMALGVIDDDIMARDQRVNGGNDALVTEVEKEGVLLLLEIGEHLLQLLMVTGVAGHHPGAHRIGKAPVGRRLGVRLADLRMVGEAEVVVQAPVQDRNAVEDHVGAEFTLEPGIHVITESLVEILPDRAARIAGDSVKDVQHGIYASMFA